nr:EF-hand domain-containing protein [uncultured Steroidobacter sp.]
MQKLVFAAIAAGACLLSATGVYAADGKEKIVAAQSFATLDRNGDGRISRSEAGFDQKLSQTFAELDTDGDGFVSVEEFSAAQENSATVGKLNPKLTSE